MEQKRRNDRKRSKTKIIPPKNNGEKTLSRDEVRSINKRKIRRKRKIKRIAFLVALALAVICAGIVLVMSVFFKIETITVKGDKVYSQKEVITQSGIETGDNLFTVNVDDLNEKLTKSLPYIDKVTVERELPDTLIITVKSTREVAALQTQTGFILLDCNGKVLDNDASMLRESVALVSGVSAKDVTEGETVVLSNESITEDFITLLKGINESGTTLLTGIDYTKSGEFELRYDDRITIKPGSVDNISVKLKRAMAAIEKENEINSYSEGVLDLKTEPYAYFSPGEEETEPPKTTRKDEDNVKGDTTEAPQDGGGTTAEGDE